MLTLFEHLLGMVAIVLFCITIVRLIAMLLDFGPYQG